MSKYARIDKEKLELCVAQTADDTHIILEYILDCLEPDIGDESWKVRSGGKEETVCDMCLYQPEQPAWRGVHPSCPVHGERR